MFTRSTLVRGLESAYKRASRYRSRESYGKCPICFYGNSWSCHETSSGYLATATAIGGFVP